MLKKAKLLRYDQTNFKQILTKIVALKRHKMSPPYPKHSPTEQHRNPRQNLFFENCSNLPENLKVRPSKFLERIAIKGRPKI